MGRQEVFQKSDSKTTQPPGLVCLRHLPHYQWMTELAECRYVAVEGIGTFLLGPEHCQCTNTLHVLLHISLVFLSI